MADAGPAPAGSVQTPNGDTDLEIHLADGSDVHGIGSFHKSLPHNPYGEVDAAAFDVLKKATSPMMTAEFRDVPPDVTHPPGSNVAPLTNPRAGLAADRLVDRPEAYTMRPAPTVLSDTTAAEMTELYWMALLRDVPFDSFSAHPDVASATTDINAAFGRAVDATGTDSSRLRPGIDVPGYPASPLPFTPHSLFRLGLPGDDVGPLLSQFFVRPVGFGTQTIDTRQLPYKAGRNYLTAFDDWLEAQNTGKDRNGQAYPNANEDGPDSFEDSPRYISTMRDLARFVNKDALHQAYFNAALLLLSGGAKWTPGNPYFPDHLREAGFGVLGGPHILALVSEVATRALKTVWHQKWQVHLRLRPEAYGGLAHVQQQGAPAGKRAYGLPSWLFQTTAAQRIAEDQRQLHGQPGYLLPMAYSPGSPTHPAYGAGHATVAGACITVLKAFFNLLEVDDQGQFKTDQAGHYKPLPFSSLFDPAPYGQKSRAKAYVTGNRSGAWERTELGRFEASQLTIEGELNKLAENVAMGRSMGGVHWRTDNARSLILGEALAARILMDICNDVVEKPTFQFRTFARDVDGQPKFVIIKGSGITVNGAGPKSNSEL